MSLSGPVATIIVALIGAIGLWLASRTQGAKKTANEKLVAAAIDHERKLHEKEVKWYQDQILYYQQMNAPKPRQRPSQPPPPLQLTPPS